MVTTYPASPVGQVRQWEWAAVLSVLITCPDWLPPVLPHPLARWGSGSELCWVLSVLITCPDWLPPVLAVSPVGHVGQWEWAVFSPFCVNHLSWPVITCPASPVGQVGQWEWALLRPFCVYHHVMTVWLPPVLPHLLARWGSGSELCSVLSVLITCPDQLSPVPPHLLARWVIGSELSLGLSVLITMSWLHGYRLSCLTCWPGGVVWVSCSPFCINHLSWLVTTCPTSPVGQARQWKVRCSSSN